MRKYLIIPLILFSFGFSQNKVNMKNLVQYGDKWFKENDDNPFTGIVFDLSKTTGNKILKSKYLKGLPHGKHSEWYESGKKKLEGHWKNGKKDGLWTYWNKYENVDSSGTYKNGNMNGLWTFLDNNGQKKEEITYEDGEINGLFIGWYENGQKW